MRNTRLNRFLKDMAKGGIFILSLGLFLSLGACDPVHQFPEMQEPDEPVFPPNEPDEPEETGILTLKLVYSPDFTIWDHLYDTQTGKITEVGLSETYSNILGSSVLETHVRVTDNNSNEVSYKTFYKTVDGNSYDSEISLELEKGNSYSVTAWSHLIENEQSLSFYDPSDFNSIKLVEDRFAGNTDYRDAFRGRVAVTAEDIDGETREVLMNRPMGKFEFVSTDLSEFLEIEAARRGASTRSIEEDYMVVISYPAYYPCAYSAYDDRLEDAAGGYSFASTISTGVHITGDNEASLGFDYVMINNVEDGAVQAQLTVLDKDGTQVAATGMMTIPIRRDHHTVLRGTFLTASGGGGIGIDPGFDGDHNITM